MPTCTQITDALNVLASATTDPSLLDDLTGLTSGLTVTFGSNSSPVQLTAGGDALLTVPSGVSLDGVLFRVIACYQGSRTSTTAASGANVWLTIGDPNNPNTTLGQGPLSFPISSAHQSNLVVFEGVWNSNSQLLTGTATGGSFVPFIVASQSDLQFQVWGQDSGISSGASEVITLTQFKLQLV